MLAFSAAPAFAACTLTSPSTWSFGASGDWNTGGHWTPSGVPNSSSTNVCIVDTVSLDVSVSVASLQLALGNGLNVNAGETLNIFGPSFLNAGAFAINGASGNAIVNIDGNTSLSGGGTLTLNSGAGGSAFLRGSGTTLTNVDNTIQGSGEIGDSGALAINNEATIDANVSGRTLDVNAASGGVTNTGTLEATSGGTLQLFNTITNTGGAITANGGTVNLFNASVTGGTLNTLGGGVMQTVGSSTLSSLTISSSSIYTTGPGATTALNGAIVNNGTLAINGTGSDAIVNLGSNVTLSGGGAVTLSSSGGAAAFLRGSGVTLTNTSSNVIQGAGFIGDSGLL